MQIPPAENDHLYITVQPEQGIFSLHCKILILSIQGNQVHIQRQQNYLLPVLECYSAPINQAF